MNHWHQIPIVRLIIPFIAGILLAIKLEYWQGLFWLLIILVSVYPVLIITFSNKIPYKLRWLPGLLQNLILVLAGYNLLIFSTPQYQEKNLIHFSNPEMAMVRVTEQISEKENSFKIVSKVLAIRDSVKWQYASGKVILYFQKDPTCGIIRYGDELIISSDLTEIASPQNPGEFNYKKYLSNKGIYHQGYVKSGSWQILGHAEGNFIKAWGIQLREKFLNILNQNELEGKEYAVVSAILLGYDEYLDSDQKQDFASAGAMHILCVSGLHVGIISTILMLGIYYLKRRKYLKWAGLVIVLAILWLYASITGFSPSVLRATIMFSFINIGLTLKHRINIFNMLAASAFLLLIINPYIITEVGFQLSYLAVAGILLLYKPIYQFFNIRYWFIDKIWQITVVSIAATLATFPLSIYYFHQFPKLFLLTNLIAIPASMLIIYAGILVLVFSPIKLISAFIGKILSYIIWFLNSSVSWIENLSFSTASGILISQAELLLIFGMIGSLVMLITLKKKFYIFSLLTLSIFLVSSLLFREYSTFKQSQITIYSIKNSSAIDFKINDKIISLADSSILTNPGKYNYQIQNNRYPVKPDKIEIFNISDSIIDREDFKKVDNFIFFKDRVIVIADNNLRPRPLKNKLQIDYLIYTQNGSTPIEALIQSFEFKELIVDNSLPWWEADRIITECEKHNIKFHNIADAGAWTLKTDN
jgi:competence protein ComEC